MSHGNGRDLVLRFLSSIGRPREFDQYLRVFAAERQRFALIVVSDAVVRDALAALVADIRFLTELNLFPTLVFGAADPKGAARRIERVRTALGAGVSTAVIGMAEAMAGGPADVVTLVLQGPETEDIDARFSALAELAKQREVRKVVFLGRRSGLQPPHGRVVPLIDLPPQLHGTGAHVAEADEAYRSAFRGRQASLYRQIVRMFAAVPHSFTVSVTSPLDLLRELFTVKGAGTLVRRGLPVTRFHSSTALGDAKADGAASVARTAVDADRVLAVIAEAFGRALRGEFAAGAMDIYVAGDYRGVALVNQTPHGPYLSKFAVPLIARGEGVGSDLWRAITTDTERLFWRSRSENEVNSWYGQIADGMAKFVRDEQTWCAWWRGHVLGDISALVEFCAGAEDDFA